MKILEAEKQMTGTDFADEEGCKLRACRKLGSNLILNTNPSEAQE